MEKTNQINKDTTVQSDGIGVFFWTMVWWQNDRNIFQIFKVRIIIIIYCYITVLLLLVVLLLLLLLRLLLLLLYLLLL